MLKFVVSFVLISLSCIHCNSPLRDLVDNDLTSSISSAIAQVVNHVSNNGKIKFDIIVYGNNSTKQEKIANEIGKSMKFPYRYRKLTINDLSELIVQQSFYSVHGMNIITL
jgi:hypothetical protein